MEFVLKKQAAKVAHVNLRTEKHGEEEVLACDVKLQADVPNTWLDQLGPTVRSSFYMTEQEHSGQKPFEGPFVADGTPMPVLRHPFLGDQKFDGVQIPSAKVTLAGGSLGKVIIGCEVNEVRGSLKEGGTVSLQFRCQFEPVDDQVALVSGMLGRTVKVTVAAHGAPDEE